MRAAHRYFPALAVAALLLLTMFTATAAELPPGAARYQRDLTRQAREVWGLDAPVAVFAAQIHAESRWRADAVSPAGARGMAQFMPDTAVWISGAYRLGQPDPGNPDWALRALVSYDRYLHERVRGHTGCDRMAKVLWAYNGGLGWVRRDEARAVKAGADALDWRAVEPFNAGRSAAAFRENRAYPRVILLSYQPLYALWGEGVSC